MVKNLLDKLRKYKIINNYGFRTFLLSICSLIFGIAYCAFNIVVACIYHSVWYGVLACYCVMLIILRSNILLNGYQIGDHDNEEIKRLKQIKQYRLCGILFSVMTIFLVAMVVQLARSDKVYEYPLFVLVVVSCFTIYRVIIAIYNIVKASKHDDYNIRSLRSINFVTAFISCLSLQSPLLYAIYLGKYHNSINAITGGIVCILILVMGIVMVVKSNLILKRKIQRK